MYTVKSVDNLKPTSSSYVSCNVHRDIGSLANYPNGKSSLQMIPHDFDKLNKKIKTLKSALKVSEQHNQELHQKLKSNKEEYQKEIAKMQLDIQKYKSLYDMLIENYDSISGEYKEAKKKLRKLESHRNKNEETNEHSHNHNHNHSQSHKEIKSLLIEQDLKLENLRHENILLREEVISKAKEIAELEKEQQLIEQTYRWTPQSEVQSAAEKEEILKLKHKVASKKQTIQVLHEEKHELESIVKSLKKDNSLYLQEAKTFKKEIALIKKQNEELANKNDSILKEMSLLNARSNTDRTEDKKWKTMFEELNEKYNEILTYSYDLQRDFERELHTMAKELTRRHLVREKTASSNNLL